LMSAVGAQLGWLHLNWAATMCGLPVHSWSFITQVKTVWAVTSNVGSILYYSSLPSTIRKVSECRIQGTRHSRTGCCSDSKTPSRGRRSRLVVRACHPLAPASSRLAHSRRTTEVAPAP
jgi:hypothetical protein